MFERDRIELCQQIFDPIISSYLTCTSSYSNGRPATCDQVLLWDLSNLLRPTFSLTSLPFLAHPNFLVLLVFIQENQKRISSDRHYDQLTIPLHLGAAWKRFCSILTIVSFSIQFFLFFFRREVWPENDCFGHKEMAQEEEYLALRQIFFADLGGEFLIKLKFFKKNF